MGPYCLPPPADNGRNAFFRRQHQRFCQRNADRAAARQRKRYRLFVKRPVAIAGAITGRQLQPLFLISFRQIGAKLIRRLLHGGACRAFGQQRFAVAAFGKECERNIFRRRANRYRQ